MPTMIDTLVNYCVINGYVSEQQAPWLKYGLQKRIIGLIVAIPFILLGILVSNIPLTITYYSCFRFLRCRTNGLHAKTVLGCFLASIICVVFFLGLIAPALNFWITYILLAGSSAVIFFLAPYKHPNLELSKIEISVCARSSKFRLCTMLFAYLVMTFFKFHCIAKGIVLSIVTTAVMLVLAYILKKGDKVDGNT